MKIESLTWVRDRFLRLKDVWLCHPAGNQKRSILSARRIGEEWLLRLEGIDSPEAAKPWHGAFLCVPDTETVRPNGGWIAADIAGMQVLDEDGQDLGTGVSLEELPGGDAVLCRTSDGKQEVFLPLEGAFKCTVNPETRTITGSRVLWETLLV